MSSEDLKIIDMTVGNNPEQVDTVLDEDDNVIAGTPPIIFLKKILFKPAENLDESFYLK